MSDERKPVIAMAQVGRQTVDKGREATMPVLSDLRESGNIEQDADLVVFLHEPTHDGDPSIPAADRCEDGTSMRGAISGALGHKYQVVNVAKAREGTTGSFGVDFDPAHMQYTCIYHGEGMR